MPLTRLRAVAALWIVAACTPFRGAVEDTDGGRATTRDAAATADADAEADAGGVDASLAWSWEATETDGWSISEWNGCGCSSTSLSPCPGAMPGILLDGGVASFTSGADTIDAQHKLGGFIAGRRSVKVAPDRPYRLTASIVGLGASATGPFGNEATQHPQWTLSVVETLPDGGTSTLGKATEPWGAVACTSCPGGALPEIEIDFTPSGDMVDVALSAFHVSSQCDCQITDVHVDVDYVRIRPL